MRGRDLLIFIGLTVASFIIGHRVIGVEFKDYSTLISFLSIVFGFLITSLSILYNSKLLNVLYDTKSKVYRTELHRLKAYFAFSLNFLILVIVLLLILEEKVTIEIKEYILDLYKSWLILPILVNTFYCFSKISSLLLRYFVIKRNE